MSNHAAPRRRSVWRTLKSTRVRAILSLGIILGLGTTGTMAYWSDQAILTTGSFKAGKLDVKVGSPAVDNNPPEFVTAFAMDNMVPGGFKDALLTITNAGTVPFTFTMSGAATNNGAGTNQMGSALRLSVFPTGSPGACSGTAIVTDVVPTGTILSAQPSLPSLATRTLCFRATLPTTADTALQGQSSVITLTLTANQIP